MEQRYVYYQVPRARLAPVCAAVRAVQQAWVAREPGLQAQLLLRRDEAVTAASATLMEIWSWPTAGCDPAAQAAVWAGLDHDLLTALGDALIGKRHVEAFGAAPG